MSSEKSTASRQSTPLTLQKKLIFYSIPLGFLLIVLECGLKLADPEQIMVREDDPEMVYSFYPERQGIAATPEYRVEVQTDGRGLRSCETESTAAAGAPRRSALVLGDSFAEGWGVPCEKSFAGLLDRDPNLNLKVHNGGLHGGSPGYYILRYRALRELDHNALIVQIFDNDLDDLDKFAPYVLRDTNGRLVGGRAAGLGPIPPGGLSRFLKNRGLYRAIKRIYYGVRGRPLPIKYYRPGRAPDEKILSHAESIERFGAPDALKDAQVDYGGQFAFYEFANRAELDADPVWASRYERMHRNLTQLITEARGHRPDLNIVLVYIPAMEAFAPGGILGQGGNQPLSVAQMRAGNLFYGLLRQLADENQVTLVDGQEVLHAGARDLYFPGDAHLNEAGHARVAGAIAEVLAE